MMWNPRSIPAKHKALFAGISVSMVCAVTLVVVGCLKANAENARARQHISSPETSSTQFQLESEERPPSQINEWTAFAIYHPSSRLSEDNILQSFRKSEGEDIQDAKLNSMQVLGARSLIPILRSTFGDQIRGSTENERDTWFTTHPTALFTPEQLRALCDNDPSDALAGVSEPCWKPTLSEAYLSALTDFASDACPQLVDKEFKNNILVSNKLVRHRDFRDAGIRHFSQVSLRIPQDKISAPWLEKIKQDAIRSLKANLDDQEIKTDADLDAHTADLYTLACQAILLSPEFYTR